MEKEFYLKVKFPDGKELSHLKMESLIAFALKEELQLESEDFFNKLDVTCTNEK